MSNKVFIAIPKSLFEDNNLSNRERMKRVEELTKKQLLHDEFKPISHKALTIGRSPKKEFIAIPKLKFRVWDKVECMMITTSDYEDLSDLFCILRNDADTGYISEPMQSTGLFDMYDKEIFDGDVLKMYDGELAKVVRNKYLGCWEARFLDEIVDLNEVADIKSNRSDCEVVGNIYENPELMEEAK